MGQGRWWQPPGLSQQVRPQHLRPGRYCGMGHRLWRGQHPWRGRLRVRWYLLDRLRYVLPTGKPHWLLLQLLGLLRPAVLDLDGQREEPLEPGCCCYAERWISKWEEEGCCSGCWM